MLEAERVRREKFGSEGGEVPLRLCVAGGTSLRFWVRAPLPIYSRSLVNLTENTEHS